jgi:hypothetical protein
MPTNVLPVLRRSASFAAALAKEAVLAQQRGVQHDTDVLLRHVEARLARLRTAADRAGVDPADVRLADRLAAALRALILATASASAADRARVRAAVHYFGLRRDVRSGRHLGRSLADDLRVVNRAAAEVGRDDLAVADEPPDGRPEPAPRARGGVHAGRGRGPAPRQVTDRWAVVGSPSGRIPADQVRP